MTDTLTLQRRDWQRSLRSRNVAEATRPIYDTAAAQFCAWLAETGGATDPADIGKREVEGSIEYMIATAVDGLDFEADVAHVVGKGRCLRALPFGDKTGTALTRYLRARSRDKDANAPNCGLPRRARGRYTRTGSS